ncbi:unnamed protein product [Closterium sp. NIES-64]|nr:unnamed protein product [Closterium sp. NIES-64]
MATPSVLTFDAEGRPVDFEVCVDDLQLFLQCDRADGLSLFDLTSGASPAPAANADPTVRSQWATRDAAARLAVRRHLPTAERAHFSQYKSAKTFDIRYRAALPADFCAKNPPPMYITLYYIVTRLLNTLRSVRVHFLSVCPTTLTVDLLEERLLEAEKDLVGLESVSAASTPSGRRRSGKGKGGKGAGGGGRGSGGGDGGREEGVVVAVGVVAGVGALVAAVEAEEVAVVAVRAGVAEVEAVVEVAAAEVEL